MPLSSGSRRRPAVLALVACLGLGGCFRLGPERLAEDQLGYSRALTGSEKQQTLLNIVELRYGDTPTFLDATQVISGYQLQKSVNGGFEAFPAADPSTFLNGAAAVQLQESPTFTFQPVSGEQFAESFIRPLSPVDLLPLALGGLPVDVLFRLAVQSVNGLENSISLARADTNGSAGFFRLTSDMRRLQIAGLLGVREAPAPTAAGAAGAAKPARLSDRTELILATSSDPELRPVVLEARHLLGMRPDQSSAVVIYGRDPATPGEVAILTRPMLGVLAGIAFVIEVPPRDVERGSTIPSIGLGRFEDRPPIRIHAGPAAPEAAFATVRYRGTVFWIDDRDFDSKVAFTILQLLLQLAKTSSAPGTVITIPAG